MKYLLFLFLFPYLAIAQDDLYGDKVKPKMDNDMKKWAGDKASVCEYLKNEKDEFTKKQVIEVGTDLCTLILDGDEIFFRYSLTIISFSGLGNKLQVEKGSTFYLRLEDDTVLNLLIEDAKHLTNSSGGGIIITCRLTEDQLDSLTKHPAIRFRINLGIDKQDGDINTRKGRKLMQGAQCLKMHLDYERYKASKK
ncbi:hypothetical protein QNI16_12455 [Cytophagaceae bacterium YF14B1]|uniref:DUF4468 domain-containing protein n=1 Tax=Xanthocytophaga flava TaxID=3048013 RepID=A0AAE3QQE2_9BACT|nr:hypothetical protein [Xanthocytophaga flavus]MDJ1481300.1 hypothetical protein [Xanthocytophaga flavus]